MNTQKDAVWDVVSLSVCCFQTTLFLACLEPQREHIDRSEIGSPNLWLLIRFSFLGHQQGSGLKKSNFIVRICPVPFVAGGCLPLLKAVTPY